MKGPFDGDRECLTKDTRVLNTIQGYQIQLFCGTTLPNSLATRRGILTGASSSNVGEGELSALEGSNFSLPQQSRGFLLHPIPGSQKEWPDKASDQSKHLNN